MNRREFLKAGAAITGLRMSAGRAPAAEVTGSRLTTRPAAMVQTVRGPIPAAEMGLTLPHEHVMCDFIGAERTGPHRWRRDEVVEVMRPYLKAACAAGVRTFVDCTPMFIGRDPEVLARLSEETGLHILTNTGLYKEPFLPPAAFNASPRALADEWILEYRRGIGGTGIRPGFIKIAVNPGPLVAVQKTIVRAAAIAGRETGMVIACHSGHAGATHEALDLLQAENVRPDRFIFVHAGSESNQAEHFAIARRGAWVEYDHLGPDSTERSLSLVQDMLSKGFENRLLLSHDAGWYNVGEARGGEPAGKIRGFTYLCETFLPKLRERGVSDATIRRLVAENPARAFSLDRSG